MVAACVGLAGCMGLGSPIARRVPGPADAKQFANSAESSPYARYQAYYADPVKLALWRISQWDSAIANIKGANTASNAGLAGIATAIGYRAARDLSKTATVGLAAGGLYGMSMSEAFVQVGRINAYSAGIQAMECALGAYGRPKPIKGEVVAFPFTDATYTMLQQAVGTNADRAATYQEIRRLVVQADYLVDRTMLQQVSVITGQVDAALAGSLITPQSRGGDWTAAFQAQFVPPATEKMFPTDDEDARRLKVALAEARAYASTAAARATAIEACDLAADLEPVVAERIAQPVRADLLGKSAPLEAAAGTPVSFLAAGGTPPYQVVVAGNTGDKKVTATVDNATRLVTVTVESGAPAGRYEVAVSDASGRDAAVVPVDVSK